MTPSEVIKEPAGVESQLDYFPHGNVGNDSGNLERGANFKEILQGVRDHPLVGLLWVILNYGPVSGFATHVIYKSLGFSEETLLYCRANAVYELLGPWGLKALKQHFCPAIDTQELRRRRNLASGEPPSVRLRKGLGGESPFVEKPGQLALEVFGSQENSLLAPAGAFPRQRRAPTERNWALRWIVEVLTHPSRRVVPYAEHDRDVVFRQMAKEFETAYGRRIKPYLSWDEMVLLLEVSKASLTREEAPTALEAMAVFFSKATAGLARLISQERKAPQYPGGIDIELLEKGMIDAALGLLSLSKRRGVAESARKQAEEVREVIWGIKPFESLKKVLKILGLVDFRGGFFSQLWLKDHFGASQFQEILVPTVDGKGSLILALHKDLEFFRSGGRPTLKDYPPLAALALRYPYHKELKVIDGDGTVIFVNSEAVREQLLSGCPPDNDETVKSFISLEGGFSPREKRPLLPPAVPVQVFP